MLEWIISSSVLIAVIVLLRFVLRGKISLRLQYALWALVLVRLLLPVSFGNSSMSVMNQVESSQVYREFLSPSSDETPTIHTPGVVLPDFSEGTAVTPPTPGTPTPPVSNPPGAPLSGNSGNIDQTAQNTPTQSETPPEQDIEQKPTENTLDWTHILRAVWLVGGILLGAWFVLINLKFAARLRKNRTEISSAQALPVFLCDEVDTPCLFGFFRPAVYLTGEVAADKPTMRHALEHEITHYRHMDHIWAVLRCVCLSVHWYNPLVWYAAILSKIDAELACDESTIRRLGENERAEYGRTLLRLTCEKRTAIMTAATTMTSSGKMIKERIALIVKRPKMALYTLIAVLAITAVAIVCTFTGAEDKDTETQLWPENTPISCARFEYTGDTGYKIITSEVSQFNSLQHMNLLPVEGEFTGEVIYRLILNWNEVATNETEYIILVSEECLSVNGQLYQPDGFDFSEILSYFEGKYRYFDYELLYDDNKDENDEEVVDEFLAYILRRLESLKPEDIKSFDNMPADAQIIAPLINAAAENYTLDYISDNMGEWSVGIYLNESPEDPTLNAERFFFWIDTREGIVDVHYRADTQPEPSDSLTVRLYSVELWNYIFSLYNIDGIDRFALEKFEDILSARAQQTMENHNAICEAYNLPAFTGFEIRYLRLRDSFDRNGRVYQLYDWDVGFLTDDPDPGRYAWPQDGWVDSENRVILYEQAREFVAAWRHDDLEYEFFGDGFQYYSQLRVRASIIEHFTGEKLYLEGEVGSIRTTIYTNNGISIEVPNQLHSFLEMHTDPDTWCDGLVMNPSYYFNLSHMNDQTLFSLFHLCEYWQSGGEGGLIFSIRRYNEDEYQTMYLNSYSRQQVFARDENYYYCVFIPTGTNSAALEKPDTLNWYLDKILPDMIERNGWMPFSENSVRIRDISVVPEEYKDIIWERAEETLIEHNRTYEDRGLPFFTGYEVLSFEAKDSFKRDGADYKIYQWEIVFYTDDPNANEYQWGGSPFVDEQYRVHYYDQHTYFVVYRDTKYVKWDFFHFDLYSDPRDIVFDRLTEHFTAEVETLPVLPLSDSESAAINNALTQDLRTDWWKGGASQTYYSANEAGVFECVWREKMNYTERFYGYAGFFRFDENMICTEHFCAPVIVTLNTQAQTIIDIWWPGDGAYYEIDILGHFPDEIAEFVAEPNEERTDVITARLLAAAKAQIQSYDLTVFLENLPDAVVQYAADYVQGIVDYHNALGAAPDDGTSYYTIVEAKITNIEQIPTGAVGLTDGINLYRLSYRLLADHPENIMLAGGMTMDGKWLTEQGSTGQPYLLLHYDKSGSETIWTHICVTNTDVIMMDYGTPEMLERYGSPYLAASIELYHQYMPENTANSWSEPFVLPVTLPVLDLSDEEYEAICNTVMIDLKTGWWTGGELADCAYETAAFECVYRETVDYFERFYGYAGYFRFDEYGNCVQHWYSPTIVTLDANTLQMYNAWWPGDGAYHEMDILARFPDEIAEFVAEPNAERYQVILGRLLNLAKNK